MQNEFEKDVAEQELTAMMSRSERYRLLEAAVLILKICGVVYLLASLYGLFLTPASAGSRRSVADDIGPVGTVFALGKDALVAFFVFVSGELIRLQLQIRKMLGDKS